LELRNRLLASLRTEDLRLFERHLREAPIEQGEMLEEPGRFVDAVYFPQNGMISLIVQMPEDSSVEVCIPASRFGWAERAHSRPDRQVLGAATGTNTTNGGM
jgi:hypothetical protein